MAVAIAGRREAVGFLEELDEVGGVRERADDADLRDRFRSGEQQQTRMDEPLTDEPLVRRHLVDPAELLLERRERTVGLLGQLLDRALPENMSVDDLFEVLLGRIDTAEHLALQTAVLVGDDVVDQFGHLEVSGSRIVQAPLVAQVAGRTEEDAADGGTPYRCGCW